MKKSVLCCLLLLYSCSCNDNKEKENIVYDEIDYPKIKNNFSTQQFSKYVDKHIYASFTPSIGDINLLAVPIAFSDYPVTNEEENLVISNTNEKFLYNFKILSLNKILVKLLFSLNKLNYFFVKFRILLYMYIVESID